MKISCIEVEELLRGLSGVKDVAVLSERNEEWGERLTVAVVLDNEKLTRDDFEAKLGEVLPSFKIPKKFYYIDNIPRDPLFKVRREELISLISGYEDQV